MNFLANPIYFNPMFFCIDIQMFKYSYESSGKTYLSDFGWLILDRPAEFLAAPPIDPNISLNIKPYSKI